MTPENGCFGLDFLIKPICQIQPSIIDAITECKIAFLLSWLFPLRVHPTAILIFLICSKNTWIFAENKSGISLLMSIKEQMNLIMIV